MRQIILDTETTGLDPSLGHRIIEIAAVEIVNRRYTNNHFHCYVNPERDSDEAALRIHGLTTEFLSDKKKFSEVASEFLEFVRGAELVIHNAAFDLAFLNHELNLLSLQPIVSCCPAVVDTLKLARELHPGKRNGLDTLCSRYGIDNSARTLHGALLDAQLLAEVYLAMTRGQETLIMEEERLYIEVAPMQSPRVGLLLKVVPLTVEETLAHKQYVWELEKCSQGVSLWSSSRSELEELALR